MSEDREQHLEAQLSQAQAAVERGRRMLSIFRSLVRRLAAGSAAADEFAQQLESRLGAYGRAQAALTRDPLSGADLAGLLGEELLAHSVREGDQVALHGPDLRLQPRAAELFALLFNELVVNAIKFGALRRDEGRIDVHWHVSRDGGDRRFEFRWRETDAGEAPLRGPDGFGTEFVRRTLPQELGAEGELTHSPGGTTCAIKVPAEAVLVSA